MICRSARSNSRSEQRSRGEEHTLSRTVFLHVGVAKTGTTYLQRTMALNRSLLREHDVLYPGRKNSAHFMASLDLRNATFHSHSYAKSAGAWAKLVSETNAWHGSTVISHETFARTPHKRIREAVASFDTDDVRVVVTARDLGRQLPAVWQEGAKNRNTQSYDDFLGEALGAANGIDSAASTSGSDVTARINSFWNVHDIAAVAERWAQAVDSSSVIIVTVPPTGSDRHELWRRFAQAVELPAAAYDFDDSKPNTSLGAAESELLRILNERLPAEVDWRTYERRIKRGFVQQTLARQRSHGTLGLPTRWQSLVEELAEDTVQALGSGGYSVVGNLADLRPRWQRDEGMLPQQLTDRQLLEVAVSLLGSLVTEDSQETTGKEPGLRNSGNQVVGRLRNKVRGNR
ncbi:MAG: hypothetical protein ACR2GB_04740 [Nocardioidaceae bacterium]